MSANTLRSYRKTGTIWIGVAVCFFCMFRPARASEKPRDAGNFAEAICPVVYPLDETPSEKGYHYLFYGNAFFINEDGYLVTAAHLLHSFKDGGQPHVLVEMPSGQRHLLKAEVVATDWEHDVAILRATPNPFEGSYRVAFLPLATDRLEPGKGVLSISLRPSRLQEAYTFDAPLQDRSQGEVLSYQYTKTESGRQIELLLYSQKVIPGQSGSPVISEQSGEAVGFIEGRWLHPTAIPFVTSPEQIDPSPGAAVRIHYAISLLQAQGIPWHATLDNGVHATASAANARGYSGPTPLSLVAAPFPAQAFSGGEILLDAKVDTRGKVTDVRVVQGQAPFLEEVLGAVQTWTFLPACQDGHDIEARVGIVFQFAQPYLPKLMARVHEYKETATDTKDRGALPLYTLEPDYPANSVGEGSVVLNEIVDKEGRVSSIHVVRDLASLTSPTVGAVQQWKFAPGKHGGEPVDSGVIVVVTFRHPAVASRTLREESGRGACGVSMGGRCLFRQGLHLAGTGLNKAN
ncbi:MAG TPA: energy transducer TonB [Candidatus Acidoferrum sp.]|nr:energy transducer TonB [Candidatus Acidoferrum sp.]